MTKDKKIENAGILKDKEEKEKKAMLEKLALEISKKFNIEKKEAIALIKSKTLESLDNLKSQVKESSDSNLSKLNKAELEKLFLTLKGAQEVIENYSKLEIRILRENIEQNVNIEDFKNYLEKHLPAKLIEKAKNPKKFHEHILGFTLGTANSIIAIVDALYQIGAGIIKAPYHLYLVVSGKAEIEGTDEI